MDNLPLSTQNPPPHNTETTKEPPPTPPQQKKKKIKDQRDQADRRESKSATIQVRVCEWRTVENRASRRPWFRNQFGWARPTRRCRGWRFGLWRLEDCLDGTRLCPVGFWEWELVDGTQTQRWWCSVDFGSKGRGRSRKREIGDVNLTVQSRCCVWGWGASVSPPFSLSFSLRLCLWVLSLSFSLFGSDLKVK